MKILHITTQKPNSTGSGTYMCAIVKGFKKVGYEQAIIAGIDKKDNKETPIENVEYYPVLYNTSELPFSVLGMSDVMPYSSTRYKDLNCTQIKMLKEGFKTQIIKAVKNFNPDIVICHHLYLLTAYVRELVNHIPVVGICHGTCLMQLTSHNLEREYISSNIKKLDKVFALHEEQRKDIIKLFDMNEEKVCVLGSGYDEEIFFNNDRQLSYNNINVTYAGKIAKLKGVKSLIKCLDKLEYNKNLLNINIIGDGHDTSEYEEILGLAKESNFKINFLGKINQIDLAKVFRESHLFILPSFFEGLPLVVIEALASGCNVVTTDIKGVKEWIGEEINNSGKIDYINLPNMKALGVPYEEEINDFECRLALSINNMLNSITKQNSRNKILDMKDKTWSGLCKRLENMI
ncbi:MAG: glycosyltransferase family 4 protein [Peptostreptococcaceae bacterium]